LQSLVSGHRDCSAAEFLGLAGLLFGSALYREFKVSVLGEIVKHYLSYEDECDKRVRRMEV